MPTRLPSRARREALFPALARYAYLDTSYRGPLCRPAIAAVEDYLRGVARGGSTAIPGWTRQLGECRDELAAHVGCQGPELVFLANATDALSRVTLGLNWRDGDEVVAPANDYPGLLRPLLDLRRRGVALRLVEPVDGLVDAAALLRACSRRTRLVAASHVNFRTGARMDAAALCAGARRKGVLSVLDCVQTAGCLQLDLHELGCDFATWAARKWFCSLDTLGVLYVRAKSLVSLTPHTMGLFSVAEPHNFDRLDQPPAEGARRFMLGAPPFAQVLALRAALGLQRRVGAARIEERVLALAASVREQAASAGYTVAPTGLPSPVVCIQRQGALADEALGKRLLRRKVVASVRPGIVRVSPHWFNDERDLDRLFAALPK